MEQVPKRNNTAIFIYFLVIVLDAISAGLIAPILAPLLANPSIFFSVDYSAFFQFCLYGLLISLFPLSFMLGAPMLGMLSDRIGRKKVLFSCLMLSVLAFLSYSAAFEYKSLAMLIAGRLLAGLSAGSQGVAQAAIVIFANKNDKPFVISVVAIGMTMGLIVGPLVACLWTQAASLTLFLTVIFFIFVVSFLLLFYVREDNQSIPVAAKPPPWQSFLKEPGILKLLILFLLFELGWSLYFQTLPLWLSLYWHLKNPQIGLINSYVGSLLALSLLFSTRLGLRYLSLSTLIQIGFGIGMLAFVSCVLQGSLWIFLWLAFPVVLGVAIIYPGLITQMSEITSKEQQGLLMGFTNTLLAFSFVVTGILSSVLTYVNPFLPFLTATFFWGVGFIFCLKHKENKLCNSVST